MGYHFLKHTGIHSLCEHNGGNNMNTSIKLFSFFTIGLLLSGVLIVISQNERVEMLENTYQPGDYLPTPTPTVAQPTPQPTPTMSEFYMLNEDIQTAPYSIYNYELDTFDCSDMSAIMCTHLDALGWDARILALTGDGIYGHAMVIVYADKTYYIESTGKRITPALMNGYTIEGEYTDIVDAVENCRWGASEWGLELYLAERSNM